MLIALSIVGYLVVGSFFGEQVRRLTFSHMRRSSGYSTLRSAHMGSLWWATVATCLWPALVPATFVYGMSKLQGIVRKTRASFKPTSEVNSDGSIEVYRRDEISSEWPTFS